MASSRNRTNKKDKNRPPVNFAALRRELKTEGPAKLYLLYGEEEYLREAFLSELRSVCVSGSEEFNYRLLDGETADMTALSEAVNALPFFAERTLTELRDLDLNKCREDQAEELKGILSDLPDYGTLVIVLPAGKEPDGRLSAVKTVRKYGREIEFDRQGQASLREWVGRRFRALGKEIRPQESDYLLFVSGNLMNRLIPEIEKVADYAKGEVITREDIDAVAHHLPEARVFEMTDRMVKGDFDGAFSVLSELQQMKDQAPVMLLAVIGIQLRRLYTARVALDKKLGREFILENTSIYQDFVADKLLDQARAFTGEQLAHAVQLAAETDFRMKSTGEDENELIRELLVRFALGETA